MERTLTLSGFFLSVFIILSRGIDALCTMYEGDAASEGIGLYRPLEVLGFQQVLLKGRNSTFHEQIIGLDNNNSQRRHGLKGRNINSTLLLFASVH